MLACFKKYPRQCVKGVADRLVVAGDVSSKNLQLLYSAGFFEQERVGKFLFYSLADEDDLLDEVLRLVALDQANYDGIIYELTAMTHERRIRIVAALEGRPLEFNELCFRTCISRLAMGRQLDKLIRRGFVQQVEQKCSLVIPDDALGKKLVELALKSVTPAQV
ncbi:helix-turn-helix domain-containing protein [Pontiella sulfatireligans]|uniref:HTH arsR-type domain-containing protein n=1 Tax=Pontiella sulfatireligans TaxID=2750658 RepID=A0A6C2UIV2_9BACT|nr:hypothetical protein [Pontiella sulfatireligans]VGO20145.1 hypothetical protein SCARR_02206 [Pontiella sulfatireligans]